MVNARPPAAVAGGNVETSQRIVDVLLRALAKAMPDRVPAGSSGTMNNLTIGGMDERTGEPFAYYETIAGGMGARPDRNGVSGVHTHMTNSLNTPAEALEYAYPLRVTEYSLRKGSGGQGSSVAETELCAKWSCWRIPKSRCWRIVAAAVLTACRAALTVRPDELKLSIKTARVKHFPAKPACA